jgi:hypothetical protein
MLRDEVWLKFADDRELLCVLCMFERAKKRQIHLGLSSLKVCEVNLFHAPHSAYDWFLRREKQPSPAILNEWQALIDTIAADRKRRLKEQRIFEAQWREREAHNWKQLSFELGPSAA